MSKERIKFHLKKLKEEIDLYKNYNDPKFIDNYCQKIKDNEIRIYEIPSELLKNNKIILNLLISEMSNYNYKIYDISQEMFFEAYKINKEKLINCIGCIRNIEKLCKENFKIIEYVVKVDPSKINYCKDRIDKFSDELLCKLIDINPDVFKSIYQPSRKVIVHYLWVTCPKVWDLFADTTEAYEMFLKTK